LEERDQFVNRLKKKDDDKTKQKGYKQPDYESCKFIIFSNFDTKFSGQNYIKIIVKKMTNKIKALLWGLWV
jgi:hypothetical protein